MRFHFCFSFPPFSPSNFTSFPLAYPELVSDHKDCALLECKLNTGALFHLSSSTSAYPVLILILALQQSSGEYLNGTGFKYDPSKPDNVHFEVVELREFFGICILCKVNKVNVR